VTLNRVTSAPSCFERHQGRTTCESNQPLQSQDTNYTHFRPLIGVVGSGAKSANRRVHEGPQIGGQTRPCIVVLLGIRAGSARGPCKAIRDDFRPLCANVPQATGPPPPRFFTQRIGLVELLLGLVELLRVRSAAPLAEQALTTCHPLQVAESQTFSWVWRWVSDMVPNQS
jgi:hypothetical protein